MDQHSESEMLKMHYTLRPWKTLSLSRLHVMYTTTVAREPHASGPRYSVLDIAHKYRVAIPSLERNIAVSRESQALSATVSSGPPRNPSCMYHVCSRIGIFPPGIYGVPRARLQPSRRCSPPSMRPISPVFRPQASHPGQNISFVSICAIVAMVGIDTD